MQKNSLQSLVIHGKMGFSVEKYVGNVDNFPKGVPVENRENGDFQGIFKSKFRSILDVIVRKRIWKRKTREASTARARSALR